MSDHDAAEVIFHRYVDGTVVDERTRDGETEGFARIADEVLDELRPAAWLFRPAHSPHEGYAILREEVDELWDEVKANHIDEGIREAIQVAAMAIRYVYDIRKWQQR
jgi:hypothetical protein